MVKRRRTFPLLRVHLAEVHWPRLCSLERLLQTTKGHIERSGMLGLVHWDAWVQDAFKLSVRVASRGALGPLSLSMASLLKFPS